MAKSKAGGTRAYIRGKIGADVYSIGKDGKGKKQQVVRSLAEQVKNPQTLSQMKGRMYMSTVMQAVSALSPVIDHSFDGVANGQPSISEFIRRNYQLVKADAQAHPASGNSFGLVEYQAKGAKAGLYVVAAGSAIVPAVVTDASTASAAVMSIAVSGETVTAGAVREALGAAVGDYLTLVVIDTAGKGQYGRAIIADTLADDTTLTADNVASLFAFEGTFLPTVSLATGAITISAPAAVVPASTGIIVSQQDNGGWRHSDAVLVNRVATIDYTADVAIASYPIGTERFLNGGDL